ncbi:MAG TPA: peptide deformylase, partial [Candidatus Kapabacteria bacterium]|nr:peptide deformylase [Candidatus Kapabacteria bacterium]
TEGCLSVPELWEDVERPLEIEVQYNDLNMKEYKTTFSGFLARVFQHEYDHLQGILFFERIAPLRRVLIKNKLKKIEKGQILPDYPMVLPNGQVVDR